MLRLITGISLGILATVFFYESSNMLSKTKQVIESKIDEQYPKVRDSLASLSETGIPINFQDIVPSIKTFRNRLLNDQKTKPLKDSNYYVQVGAFSRVEDGEQLKASLLLKGFLSQHIFVESDNSEKIHRVLIGPYTEKGKALMSLSWAHRQEFDGLIVQRSKS